MLHITLWFAVEGTTRALRFAVSPTGTITLGGVTITISTDTGFGSMVILKRFVSDDTIFIALTVNSNVPAVVGIPEITPALLKVKPVGKLPLVISQLIGLVPLAISVWL